MVCLDAGIHIIEIFSIEITITIDKMKDLKNLYKGQHQEQASRNIERRVLI